MQKHNNKIETSNNQNNLSPKKSITTNPIDKSGLVAKINVLGSGMNTGKLAHSSTNYHSEKAYGVVDYASFIKETNEIIKHHTTLRDSLTSFHNMFINRLNANYTALGIINEQSSTIEIKLLDKNANVYSFKVFMSDKENEIIKAIDNDEIRV